MFVAETVNAISKRLNGAIESELLGSNPRIWPSNLAIVRKVWAQAMRGLQLRLENLHKQRFTAYASNEYLDLHASEEGLSRIPALYASGKVDIVTVAGTVIPAGTQMTFASLTYETMASVTATTVLTSVNIQATDPGEIGNVEAGAVMRLVEPVDGIGTITVADTGIVGGAEQETDDSLRERILFSKRNPPSGGSPSEYIEWSRRKAGVTRVWVKRATPAAGSVTIYFAMDNAYPNGVPAAEEVADLQGQLNELAPADATVIVAAPDTLAIDVEVASVTPNTAAIREGIVQELGSMFLRRAEPGSVFARDWLAEAVMSVPGIQRGKIADPADDVTPGADELPILGTVSFS